MAQAQKADQVKRSELTMALSGVFGAITSTLITHPLDTIRVRLQAGQNLYTAAKIRTLYQGVIPPLFASVPLASVCFGTYEFASNTLKDTFPGTNSVFTIAFLAGAISAYPTVILGIPMDRVKLLQQLNRSSFEGHSSTSETVRTIFAKEGRAGFYKGLSITLIRDNIGCGVWFGTYESVKQSLMKKYGKPNSKKPEAWMSMLSGGIAGGAAWTFTMPIDTVKTKFQSQHHYRRYIEAIRDLQKLAEQHASLYKLSARTATMHTLFKGFRFAMVRAMFGNAISWACVEFAISVINGTN
ncbi:hypothetical protein MP638_005282 [Amoeboaphelidium occidentale]|nr:hypothetical protein MP638_005282 [Amoeboaphelidium occidentale]